MYTSMINFIQIRAPFPHNFKAIGGIKIDSQHFIDFLRINIKPFLRWADFGEPLFGYTARSGVIRRPWCARCWCVDDAVSESSAARTLDRPTFARCEPPSIVTYGLFVIASHQNGVNMYARLPSRATNTLRSLKRTITTVREREVVNASVSIL